MDLLKVNNVVKQYAAHRALDGVSISVPSQSIFGLLGPNGAGKTSLIRIINQITAPDEGEVLIDGKKLSPHHIHEIGYLPEERGLYKKMKVGEQALYLAQLKGMSKAEAMKKLKDWFEKFEIESWWNRKVEELSKGMQQKIQFVTTVLHEPRLLILDEPFSGFDPINTRIIKQEILRLKEQGATILLSTHNMESVEELCDHIALINKSKKILGGNVKEIRKNHRTAVYEVSFEGNMIGFTNAFGASAKLLDSTEEEKVHQVKVELLNGISANDFLSAIIPYVKIHSFNEVIPSMNEIFIATVESRGESVEETI